MNLDMVVQQIRNFCPAFEGRVSGAADFAIGVDDTSTMAMPCAFVLPLSDDAEAPEALSMPGVWQDIEERIGVVVQVSNAADRRGQAAVTDVYALRAQLFRAIYNWRPGVTVDGGVDPDNPPVDANGDRSIAARSSFFYGGGKLLSFDRARLFWQFEFVLPGAISDADGFIVTGHHLDSIDWRVTNPTTGDEIGVGGLIEFEE